MLPTTPLPRRWSYPIIWPRKGDCGVPKNPDWTVDELVLALDLYLTRGLPSSYRDPQVVRLSEELRGLQAYTGVDDPDRYRNPSGVYLKITNFRAIDPNTARVGMSHGSKRDREVWDRYASDPDVLRKRAEALRGFTGRTLAPPPEQDVSWDEWEASEGRVLTREHRRRERSAALSRRKKEAAKAADSFVCEVCGFDPAVAYPNLGDSAIECHHRVPLAELAEPVRTRLTDLALVCANCHRMLHGPPARNLEDLQMGIRK